MKFSKQFKKSFSYTWYLYLIAIALPSILFPLAYSFMHRPKQYEMLSLFLPVSLKSEYVDDELFKDLEHLGIREAEIVNVESDENEYNFSKKLSVVAYNRCDIIIIPEDKLDKVGIETASLELKSEVKEACRIVAETTYKYEEVEYGVLIPKTTPLVKFGELKEEQNYYAFINQKSWNIGEFGSQKVRTENALQFMQHILGK